jgi:hypothetical protein
MQPLMSTIVPSDSLNFRDHAGGGALFHLVFDAH